MQISDSYREIRKNKITSDQDNNYIYNQLEPVEDEDICFTRQRLMEE